MSVTIPVERLAVVNGLDSPEDRVPAGTTVKRVVGGKGRSRCGKRLQQTRQQGSRYGGHIGAKDTSKS